MAERLNAAMQEAYAVAPVDVTFVHVVELNHPAFDQPVYLGSGIEVDTQVRLEDGTNVTVIACAFEVTPPGFDETGPTPASLSVDNISGLLYPYLKQASGASVAVEVTYRNFRSDSLLQPGEVIEGLLLKNVTLKALTADGELSFKEITTQGFPLRTYDLETYPGLWNT